MKFYDEVSGIYFTKSDEEIIQRIRIYAKSITAKNKNFGGCRKVIYGELKCNNAYELYLDFLPEEAKLAIMYCYCVDSLPWVECRHLFEQIYFGIILEDNEPCIHINLHPIIE